VDIAFAVGLPWQRPFGFVELLDQMVPWRAGGQQREPQKSLT